MGAEEGRGGGGTVDKEAGGGGRSGAGGGKRLEGERAAEVLARVTPIDRRPEVFKRGHTARTELQHMMASITKTADDTFLILVFRSFADTLLHDLRTAMEGVAARGRP